VEHENRFHLLFYRVIENVFRKRKKKKEKRKKNFMISSTSGFDKVLKAFSVVLDGLIK